MGKTVFETQTCSRCGGTGNYSYCQSYGTTCFKCAGTRVVLTVRGKAAALFLRKLRTKLAGDVKFGDAVLVEGCPGMSTTTYFRVEEMHTQLRSGASITYGPAGERIEKWHNHLYLTGRTPKGEETGLGTFPDAEVRIVPTKVEAVAQIEAALAYQATLTKAGTVRKKTEIAQLAPAIAD